MTSGWRVRWVSFLTAQTSVLKGHGSGAYECEHPMTISTEYQQFRTKPGDSFKLNHAKFLRIATRYGESRIPWDLIQDVAIHPISVGAEDDASDL